MPQSYLDLDLFDLELLLPRYALDPGGDDDDDGDDDDGSEEDEDYDWV